MCIVFTTCKALNEADQALWHLQPTSWAFLLASLRRGLSWCIRSTLFWLSLGTKLHTKCGLMWFSHQKVCQAPLSVNIRDQTLFVYSRVGHRVSRIVWDRNRNKDNPCFPAWHQGAAQGHTESTTYPIFSRLTVVSFRILTWEHVWRHNTWLWTAASDSFSDSFDANLQVEAGKRVKSNAANPAKPSGFTWFPEGAGCQSCFS